MPDIKKSSAWILVTQVLKHSWHRAWHTRIAVVSVGIGSLALSSPVIQDLFFEPMNFWGSILFALTILLFWTIPVHRAARAGVDSMPADPWGVNEANLEPRLNSRIRRYRYRIDVWLPRVLGAATLIVPTAVVPLIMWNLQSLAGLGDEYVATQWRLAITEGLLGAALAGYAVYLIVRERLRRKGGERRAEAMHVEPWRTLGGVHTALSLAYFAWAVLLPLGFTAVIGRISLLPVLLGSPLPILSPVAAAGNRWRMPFILFALMAVVIVSSLNGSFHDVRRFHSNESKGTVPRAAAIDDAVLAWMEANGCADAGRNCPPAMLVAASGGGSRAAFFTTTVVGELLDRIARMPGAPANPGQRIFAISGVSGGAVGAAIVRAALQDATDRQARGDTPAVQPPCRNQSKLWFGGTEQPGPWQGDLTWRRCLQNLAAGDLLSPPIAGLAYRDYLGFPVPLPENLVFADRNMLIEQALEQHYHYVIEDSPNTCSGGTGDRAICLPLGYRIDGQRSVGPWGPLLLLNTTSVDHGTLIVASDLEIGAPGDERSAKLEIANAADMFALFGSRSIDRSVDPPRRPPDAVGPPPGDDLRLSTAALLSGRFPVVLTAGNLRNLSGEVAERVVDGGYFDNSGTAALAGVRRALSSRGIRTVTLLIDSEPRASILVVEAERTQKTQATGVELDMLDISTFQNASAPLYEPLRTLERIRAVRALEAIEMYNVAERDEVLATAADHLFNIEVNSSLDAGDCVPTVALRKLEGLVVSWWLSPIGQRFADLQMCAGDNAQDFEQIESLLPAPAPTQKVAP